MADKKNSIKLKLGLDLEDYELDARDCVGCAGCRWVDFIYMPGHDFSWKCPSWQMYQYDAYGACGRLKIIYDLLHGGIDYDSETVGKVAYACTLCGACDVGCKRNLDLEPLLALESLRARLVARGKGPLPQHLPISRNIINKHNRFGLPQARRRDWLPGDARPAGKADILYFAGCRASFDRTGIGVSAVRVMKAAGVEFMMLRDEHCCGNYLYTTGQMEPARKLAAENIALIRDTGARTVLFSCAECYQTFKVDYPKLLGISTTDLPFQAQHLSEAAATWLKEGRLKLTGKNSLKSTYHDPCHLGRLSEPWDHWEGERLDWGTITPPRKSRRGTYGIYDPPRDVLKAIPGLQLVEMARHHENAWCCGNAGGVREAFPDLADWSVKERLREALATGAEAIITACPGCEHNLARAARDSGIQVCDIAEVIAKAI